MQLGWLRNAALMHHQTSYFLARFLTSGAWVEMALLQPQKENTLSSSINPMIPTKDEQRSMRWSAAACGCTVVLILLNSPGRPSSSLIACVLFLTHSTFTFTFRQCCGREMGLFWRFVVHSIHAVVWFWSCYSGFACILVVRGFAASVGLCVCLCVWIISSILSSFNSFSWFYDIICNIYNAMQRVLAIVITRLLLL